MKRNPSPAQRAALEYGQELRLIRGAIGILGNVRSRLGAYLTLLEFDKIGKLMEEAAKKKYEASRKDYELNR